MAAPPRTPREASTSPRTTVLAGVRRPTTVSEIRSPDGGGGQMVRTSDATPLQRRSPRLLALPGRISSLDAQQVALPKERASSASPRVQRAGFTERAFTERAFTEHASSASPRVHRARRGPCHRSGGRPTGRRRAPCFRERQRSTARARGTRPQSLRRRRPCGEEATAEARRRRRRWSARFSGSPPSLQLSRTAGAAPRSPHRSVRRWLHGAP